MAFVEGKAVIQSQFDIAGDADVFALTSAEAATIKITVSPDVVLSVLDADGEWFTRMQTPAQESGEIAFDVAADSVNYVVVSSASRQVATYELSLEKTEKVEESKDEVASTGFAGLADVFFATL